MIAVMRKLIHNNAYKFILWMFLIMMAMGSGLVFFRSEDDRNWVIKAYKQTITDKKFAAMLQQAKQQQEMFRQRGFSFGAQNVHKETVEAAVAGSLARHAMDKFGVNVSQSHVDKEVQKQLQQLPAYFFKENGMLNEEMFAKAIAPHTIDDFVAEIELEAKNKLLYGLVDISMYVPAFEVQLQCNAEFADKQYSYFVLSHQKYLHKVKQDNPSDETLLRFYKQPGIVDGFKSPERRSGQKWTFDASMYTASVSDSEAKSFYDKQKMSKYVVTPAQMQVRQLIIAIQPGKEQEAKNRISELKAEADKDPSMFEALVKKFSEDKASAAKGGLSDLFSKDTTKVDKVVVDTAFEFLGTDGQISSPIKTERGYELVQRVKRVPAKYKEFSAVEAEIKRDLGQEKFKKRFAQDASRVVQEARYNKDILKSFVERYHGVKSEISLGNRSAGADYTYLFKIDEGRLTQFFDKDKGVIMLCDKVEKSTTPSLEDVKAKVKELYFEQKAQDMVQEDLHKALAMTQTASFDEVAAKFDAAVNVATFKYNDGKAEQSAILKESGVAPKLKNLQYSGAVMGTKAASDGVILRLDSVEVVKGGVSETQKDQMNKILFYTKQYQSKEGFVASLYRIAKLNNKIEIKNEILQHTKEV